MHRRGQGTIIQLNLTFKFVHLMHLLAETKFAMLAEQESAVSDKF